MVATLVMLVLLLGATGYCAWAIAQGAAGLAADRRLQETAVAQAGVIESVERSDERGGGLILRYRLVEAPEALWVVRTASADSRIDEGAPLTVWVDRANPERHVIVREALLHRAWSLLGSGLAIGAVALWLWLVVLRRLAALRRHRRA